MENDLNGPGIRSSDVLSAVAGAMPALEVIDSRIADWRIKLPDTIADNASCGKVVVAGRLTTVRNLDLRLVGMSISRNGEVVDTGAGAAVLGNPLRCVAWLANRLSDFGAHLRAGDVVIAGALHKAFPVSRGDVIRAEFAALGPVSARFVDGGLKS
jgi:2-keto-4-pentenoate hydratase